VSIAELMWASAPGLLTGIVLAVFSARQRQRDRGQEEREKARKRESLLNLNLTFAAAQLAYAVAMAVKRGSPNGEVEEGVDTYEKALSEYREFEREQVSRL
jgi:predicted histidine transporter YuiF (NhaC family)